MFHFTEIWEVSTNQKLPPWVLVLVLPLNTGSAKGVYLCVAR